MCGAARARMNARENMFDSSITSALRRCLSVHSESGIPLARTMVSCDHVSVALRLKRNSQAFTDEQKLGD